MLRKDYNIVYSFTSTDVTCKNEKSPRSWDLRRLGESNRI